MKRMLFLCAGALLISTCTTQHASIGETEITKWQFGKKGAVSVTYDDGSINQFKIALPIMNKLKIPATFFIITGQIPGSQSEGRFIGRPVQTIIRETATITTGKNNFYERSSAAGYLGLEGTLDYHTRAGAEIEAGKPEEAYKIMDELYKKVRNGEFPYERRTNNEMNKDKRVTWDEIRNYAAQGHEFASHTVTHPYLCALDEVNILYELEKSREDMLTQLGQKYTFSAEVPYGSEDERALEYASKVYPAIRNRMSENIVEDLNRSDIKNPGSSSKEYVKWQRGAISETPLTLMESWIDTTAVNDNIWLVLVFHGVDGKGWEALPGELLDEYFHYMKSNDDDLWIATFGDVTKYIRERMNTTFKSTINGGKIMVNLTHSLDRTMYDLPLTLKTYVSSKWKEVQVKQGTERKSTLTQQDAGRRYVLYQAYPNAGDIELKGI
jgi:peptidoglycan/xylan/chitin deacetylase (PgdA/CDA1 family)